MAENYLKGLTGVIGQQLESNPTVVMQEAAYAQANLDWRYITMEVADEHLEQAMRGLCALGFKGFNLTIPHKVVAVSYMDKLDKSAQLIGAINTVVIDKQHMTGHNTDGQGFVSSMQEKDISLANKRLVVLGAGGASRAVCVECALAGAAQIIIMNRNKQRGKNLAELISNNTSATAKYVSWQEEIDVPSCDILINATSVGLSDKQQVPVINYDTITPDMVVQDIIPTGHTKFMSLAADKGATVYSGLGMLVHQGAVAAKLWSGRDVSIQVMSEAVDNL